MLTKALCTRWFGWSVLGLGMACATQIASAQVSAPPVCDPALSLVPQGLLASATDPARRAEAARQLEALAAAGNARARYVLGSLLRAGGNVPDNPFERNLDRAAALLSHSAVDGWSSAMLKLAEIELERERPVQAMTWLQVYFSVVIGDDERIERSHAYEAALIERIKFAGAMAGVAAQPADVHPYVEAFLAKYGEQIAAARSRAAAGAVANWANWRLPRHRFQQRAWPQRAGFAEFLVTIDHDGSILDVDLLDALPDREHGVLLGRLAERGRYNPLPHGNEACQDNTGPRVALQRITHDDRRHRAVRR